jgi:hypothetical protein
LRASSHNSTRRLNRMPFIVELLRSGRVLLFRRGLILALDRSTILLTSNEASRTSVQTIPYVGARALARRMARQSCRALLPQEPILGTSVCADEPDRYVVRGFCGNRTTSTENYRLPPWRECLIFAVTKDTYDVERLIDNEKYYPVIR